MEYYIIVYKNTLDAMKAEDIFNESKFEFKIMPTPTSITQSCGICTRISKSEDVDKIINEKLVEYKNIYKKNSEGFSIYK